MTGWLIFLAVVVLIAICPVGVGVRYDSDGPRIRVIAGFLKILVFPRKKKPKAPEEEKPAEPKKKSAKKAASKENAGKTEEKKEEPRKKGGSVLDFLPLLQVALDFLSDFRRKLRVDLLEAEVLLAGDDPCDLATNYGKAQLALHNLMPQLERFLYIRKRKIWIGCDFVADQTLIYVNLNLTITIGRLLSLVVRYGFRALREFLRIRNKRKGGAET